MMTEILVTLSDLTIPLSLRYPETAQFFPPFDPTAERAPVTPEFMSDPEWQDFLDLGMADDAHSECNALTGKCSDALIPFDRAIFHAVALRWRGYAWLIVAKSGVGKSTHYRKLKELRPDEFSMICGDRPVLDFRGEQIMVWPSPWNGKEDWGGAPASPLAGIIFLERGGENKLVALSEREAILRAYVAWVYNAKTAAAVEKIAEFETKLLTAVPLWHLTAVTVPDVDDGDSDDTHAATVNGLALPAPDAVSPVMLLSQQGKKKEGVEGFGGFTALPVLPDVSASAQLLLDHVFTDSILPHD